MARKVLLGLLVFTGLLAGFGWFVFGGGELEGPGKVEGARVPVTEIEARTKRYASPRTDAKQILFGDLHVHTTFSVDAFLRSLPLVGGEGAHPPADACDYARHCSQLDFFALTDHAEAISRRKWEASQDIMRQCEAVTGGEGTPDLIPYMGFEWTHVGRTPEEHFGHKNVIFKDLGKDNLPARPIAAPGLAQRAFTNLDAAGGLFALIKVPFLDFSERQRYLNFAADIGETGGIADCPRGVDSRTLSPDCRELAHTPQELFEKLGQWGFPVMVIPHGTTWGFYTPPRYDYAKQLVRKHQDPDRQRLMEVYSGHGNSEEYRPWRAHEIDDSGQTVCPEPRPGFEPCCHRAGLLIRARCADPDSAECEARAEAARRNYTLAGSSGHLTVQGATVEDWGTCGQCEDCFQPAFMYRPGGSAQYALARGNFERPEAPTYASYGFIASSDNHSARPGTGYKEYERRMMTEASGAKDATRREAFFGDDEEKNPHSIRHTQATIAQQLAYRIVDLERQASFFLTGGLVAVHAGARTRDGVWDAMSRREVYGTSGDRILLWFDLVNGPKGEVPMGSELTMGRNPRLRVRALGAFEQKPGCPEGVLRALGAERIQRLCVGECYHPSDRRHRLERIEIVRIRRQRSEDESIETLVDDPWHVARCDPSADLCEVEVEDPEFELDQRDVLYYARVIQEPTLTINADNLRCKKRDEHGLCVEVEPCYGDYRTSFDDECVAPDGERAWSSPIFLGYEAPAEHATPQEDQ